MIIVYLCVQLHIGTVFQTGHPSFANGEADSSFLL